MQDAPGLRSPYRTCKAMNFTMWILPKQRALLSSGTDLLTEIPEEGVFFMEENGTMAGLDHDYTFSNGLKLKTGGMIQVQDRLFDRGIIQPIMMVTWIFRI